MRLDKYLVVSRLVKQRSRAKETCDAGHVKIGGKSAKPSHNVQPGDTIELTLPRRRLVFRVAELPRSKNVSKAEAPELYEIVSDESIGSDFDGRHG
jgi:ribosomal 50S subunit-recycling heat shock protein